MGHLKSSGSTGFYGVQPGSAGFALQVLCVQPGSEARTNLAEPSRALQNLAEPSFDGHVGNGGIDGTDTKGL